MIDRNELGVKTGKGFYTYPNPEYRDPGFLQSAKESLPERAGDFDYNDISSRGGSWLARGLRLPLK